MTALCGAMEKPARYEAVPWHIVKRSWPWYNMLKSDEMESARGALPLLPPSAFFFDRCGAWYERDRVRCVTWC